MLKCEHALSGIYLLRRGSFVEFQVGNLQFGSAFLPSRSTRKERCTRKGYC